MPKGIYVRKEGVRKGIERKKIVWIEDNNGCHVCISHKQQRHPNGELWHPMKWIWERQTHIPMSRWIWEQNYGEIKNGLMVRHKCDNPRCINVEHLLLGTQTDNVADREERGRTSFGEKHRTAKLRNKDVKEIFELLKRNDSYTIRGDIAKKYNVSLAAITDIKLGRTWARITMGLPRCPLRSGRT